MQSGSESHKYTFPVYIHDRPKVKYMQSITFCFKVRIHIFHLFTWNIYCTFLMKAIMEDGGIPGFAVSAERILMFFDASESWAIFKASSVMFVTEET